MKNFAKLILRFFHRDFANIARYFAIFENIAKLFAIFETRTSEIGKDESPAPINVRARLIQDVSYLFSDGAHSRGVKSSLNLHLGGQNGEKPLKMAVFLAIFSLFQRLFVFFSKTAPTIFINISDIFKFFLLVY